MRTCVSVYAYLCSLFVVLSIPYSWSLNSLFLLDTGLFICPTTSCRSCHPAFLPGFHHLRECSCFSWLSTEILCLSESVDFLSLLDMYLSVFFSVACVCVCVCVLLCPGVFGRQTELDTLERWAKQYQHTRECANAEVTRTPLSCGGD